MNPLRGITWDHPRGYQPLETFQRLRPGAPQVLWDRQPLAGFEAHPISELASRYDLIVLDHPGLGTAIAAEALTPLERLFDEAELSSWESASLPNTWRSYHVLGHQWALPIDASTQVSVLRPDLLMDRPSRWTDVVALPRDVRFTLCLGGPHALLHLLAMSGPNSDPQLLPEKVATEALAVLQQLWRRCDQQTSLLDPIGVHDALAAADDLAYCPLAYGYAQYGRPEPGRAALGFADAPATTDGHGPGSVLGGTGLAVSQRVVDDPRVVSWIRSYLAEEIQTVLVPATGGQPARRRTWEGQDGPLSAYSSATRTSMLAARIRPRAAGWIPFQDEASEIVREAVSHGTGASVVVSEVNNLFSAEVTGGLP